MRGIILAVVMTAYLHALWSDRNDPAMPSWWGAGGFTTKDFTRPFGNSAQAATVPVGDPDFARKAEPIPIPVSHPRKNCKPAKDGKAPICSLGVGQH